MPEALIRGFSKRTDRIDAELERLTADGRERTPRWSSGPSTRPVNPRSTRPRTPCTAAGGRRRPQWDTNPTPVPGAASGSDESPAAVRDAAGVIWLFWSRSRPDPDATPGEFGSWWTCIWPVTIPPPAGMSPSGSAPRRSVAIGRSLRSPPAGGSGCSGAMPTPATTRPTCSSNSYARRREPSNHRNGRCRLSQAPHDRWSAAVATHRSSQLACSWLPVVAKLTLRGCWLCAVGPVAMRLARIVAA
jgi:hypothetical protein